MSNEDISFANAISKHCKEDKTGTILISTKNNKACQVVMNSGEIVAVVMGRLKGLEAVLEAKKVGVKAESFNGRLLPFADDAKINSSDDILKLIGISSEGATIDSTKASSSAPSSKYDEVMEFLNTDALDGGMPDLQSLSDTKSSSEKVKRMYRGQAID